METKQRTKKAEGQLPDITKLTGSLRYKIETCSINYNVGKDDDSNINFDIFTSWHHYALWNKIISLLNRRGLNVVADQKVNKSIRKWYKYGKNKYGIEFKTNIYPAGFEIKFFQNVTKSENCNGGEYDFDKYNKMPYLLKLSLRAEINAIVKLAGRFIKIENYDRKTDSTEFILDRFRTSSFTRNGIQSLSEIDSFMDEYNRSYNSIDHNKVQIKNGELKYFYNHKRVLTRGIVYHNINNMWWVILNDTEVTNEACQRLFDFVPGLPLKKELTTPEKVQKLHTALKQSEAKQKYERCIVLRGLLQKHKLYRVWSLKHNTWYAPLSAGYTSDINKAGVFTHEQITGNPSYYNNLETTEAREV